MEKLPCNNKIALIPSSTQWNFPEPKKPNLVNQYKTIANNTLFEVDLKIITNPMKIIIFTYLNDKGGGDLVFLID